MAKKATERREPAGRAKGPLWIELISRGAKPGLLCDVHSEILSDAKRLILFAEQEGIDPNAKDFWFHLALHLLRKHEPAFRPERRGRPTTIHSKSARRGRMELLDLYDAHRGGRKNHTTQLTVTAFTTWALKNKSKLPAYYRDKTRLSARMLSDEISLALRERFFWGGSGK
jgi:hypothetical protein